ncbi:serine/threonine kinase [Beauveria bassiana ARSEF 2860]|uniref:Serine/threonine kinase n=1 Tax=Beauveria bassiana (strain ARSEF 2860) TaxID=655819 RepID=J4UIH3_BEAB2|nr:serine/threonine kinase [Beauveria bassiana ARSEF 2860]EJP63322.1 serine/threonine kinase [Beauveria bassiana ARSEF 2860]
MESQWELYSIQEHWGEIDGVHMFLYTSLVYLRNKTEFWTARVPGRYPSREALPAGAAPSCGTLQHVDRTHLFPPLDPGTHRCDDDVDEPEKAGIFVKRVRVDAYDGSPTLARYVAHEARICQRLRSYPHPNIARFRGCHVRGETGGTGTGTGIGTGGEILGLCFDRYAETLAERMRRGAAVDTERCMEQIRAALRHLHGLQLVHNDVVPDNVMFVDDGPGLVLIDFDSCATRGGGLPRKRGPVRPGATRSEFENDDLGLRLIHRALLRYEHDTRS